MAEVWGWCGTCDRWFYASSSASASASASSDIGCPVCLDPPERVEIHEREPSSTP